MKKIILLLLFIPLVSLGQQYNFSELIQMTSSLRNFESSMFKKANNLKKSGMQVSMYAGVPNLLPEEIKKEQTDAAVIALKTRTIPIEDAIRDLRDCFDKNVLTNPLTNEFYFNIKRMNSIKLI